MTTALDNTVFSFPYFSMTKTYLVFFFILFYLFCFFFIRVLWPFQEYFTNMEPIIHERWANTGEPGKKPPDHP